MNYGELKTNIRDLAFEEDEQMEEYESIVINAINRAITTIAQDVTPIKAYIDVTLDGHKEVEVTQAEFNANKTKYYTLVLTPVAGGGYVGQYVQCTESSVYDENETYYIVPNYYELNMPTLTEDVFMNFDDVPVQIDDGEKYVRFNDYDIQTGDTLVMSAKYVGMFRIFFQAAHEPYAADTADNIELPLPLKSHHLVPLLSSYYIWLDDDQQKAIMYYNQYEELKNAILVKEQRPRMRVRTDWYNKSKGNNLNVSFDEWRRYY